MSLPSDLMVSHALSTPTRAAPPISIDEWLQFSVAKVTGELLLFFFPIFIPLACNYRQRGGHVGDVL